PDLTGDRGVLESSFAVATTPKIDAQARQPLLGPLSRGIREHASLQRLNLPLVADALESVQHQNCGWPGDAAGKLKRSHHLLAVNLKRDGSLTGCRQHC